jgi:hypothetical protein
VITLRRTSAEIRHAFADWLVGQRMFGVRLVVLEGLMLSGKSTLTEGLPGVIDLDHFLKRPVPETIAYVDAVDQTAMAEALTDVFATFSLVIMQGAVAWPLFQTIDTTLTRDRIRRVYLKQMRKLNPDIWATEDLLLKPFNWPRAEYARSVYRYHAEQRPWLVADLVLERIRTDDE